LSCLSQYEKQDNTQLHTQLNQLVHLLSTPNLPY
jgi:hypothetical protein